MNITLSIRATLLIAVGVGLGYAKAVHDSEDTSVRLERMENKIDEILRHQKYGNYIEEGFIDADEVKEEPKQETPEEEVIS